MDTLDQVRKMVSKAKNAMLELGDKEKYIIYDPETDGWKILDEQPTADISHWLVNQAGEVMAHLAMPKSGKYNYQPALALSISKEF